MSGSVLNSLNQDNIIFFRTSIDEGMEDYSTSEMKALQKDKAFMQIWNGGVIQGKLKIKSMLSEEDGHLVLNGRRFTRSSWNWRPPEVIRGQGRLAKEYSDPRNVHPEIAIVTQNGSVLWLDACPCGGELLMDNNSNLYCSKCNIIY